MWVCLVAVKRLFFPALVTVRSLTAILGQVRQSCAWGWEVAFVA